MEIRSEKSGEKRKYIINGMEYARLEDVPEEFQSLFKDENNNSIPDMMEPGNLLGSFFKRQKIICSTTLIRPKK